MSDFTLSNPIGSEVEDEDVRTTPRWLFDAFDARLHFGLDAAASADNALCERYIDQERDALTLDWAVQSQGSAAWCNPPFSRLGEFARKAADTGRDIEVAFAMPANRWEQAWLHDTVLESASYLVFPRGRVAYGGSGKSPEWPSVVVVWTPWSRGLRQAMTLEQWSSGVEA